MGKISIKASEKAGMVCLNYEDNGKGLSQQGLEDLFNPFYTTKRGKQGRIGLGMYQVYNIINHLLHGKIKAEPCQHGIKLVLEFPAQLEN